VSKELCPYIKLKIEIRHVQMRALGCWNHCFVVMASDYNNPERSSVERQYLPVIGASLPKGSNRFRIELASSALAEKAFER